MADRIRSPREDLLTTIANATLGENPCHRVIWMVHGC